jgi:hypothetical protein
VKRWIIAGVLLCMLGVSLAFVQPARRPKPELRIVGTVIHGGIDMYEMEFINPTTYELVYYGYQTSSPTLVSEYWEHGAWKRAEGIGCGSGIRAYVVPAGGTVRFFQTPPREHPIRIGLVAHPQNFKGWVIRQYHWLPEKLNSWVMEWQQERNHKRGEEMVSWAPPLEVVPIMPSEIAAVEALQAGVVMDPVNSKEERP